MAKISGDLHIVDFKSKRIIASLKPEDYIEDLRHWEIKDNADILDFKLLDNSPFLDYIQQQNLVLKETRPGVITPYVITGIEKDSSAHITTIYASGEWILLDKDSYLSPQTITSWSAQQFMSFATARTEWEIGIIEATGTRSTVTQNFTSPLRFIRETASLFDMEIQYRIVMNPTKPPTRYIDLVKKRGHDTSKEIILGKDLIGIKRKETSENIITALVPFIMGKDVNGNDKLITIESVNNGLQYIADDEAFQRWNVNGKHKFGFYTPDSENQDMTPTRLLTLAKTELKKRISTIVTYEVDSVDISRVFGYEHEQVNEGDTIRIIDEGMKPTLYLEARAIAGEESHRDPRRNNYTFGNFREIVNNDEALRKLYQKMLSMINDKVSKEWFAALEDKVIETENKANTAVQESQTAKDLATQTKNYVDQNTVTIDTQPTAPTANLKDGKSIWVDNSDPKNNVQKIWKNGTWQRITPDIAPLQSDINAAKQDILTTKQQLATAQTDINTAKQDIVNNKTNLQNQINTANQEIGTIKTDVSKKVDQTWIDSQLQDKADKSGVYTKDYIDKNLVGKSIYETDKQGNITKFTNLETKQTQTETALTNKAEKSELTTLSNNLTGVSNKVNTVEQTAESNKQRITATEGTLNTVTGDVTNLKTKTNEITQTVDSNIQKITSLENKKVGSNNLAKSNPDKVILLPRDSSVSNHNYNYATIAAEMQMDREYTISARVAFTTPLTSTKISVYPYTNGVSVAVDIKDGFISHTFKKTNVNITRILLYAGIAGQTTNIGAEFTEIMVTEGNTVVAYAPPAPTLSEYTQKTNEIKQTADENSATITKVTATVTGGNDNLLKNSRLEDMSSWMSFAGVAIDPTVMFNGYNSMKSIQSGLATDSYRGLMQQNIPFEIGGNFVFSVYIYTDDVSTLDMGIRLEVICEKDDNTRTKTYNIAVGQPQPNIVLPGNGVWTRYIIIADNIPALTTKVRAGARVVKNGRAWFSNPQWERGLLVTAFKPSSLETPSTIQTNSIKQTVEGFETKITNITNKSDQLEIKTNTLQTTVDGHTNQITNVTNKADQTEIKTNTLETTVNGQAQTITNITNRTGTLESKTNQLRNDTDQNTATLTQVTQSIAGGNENYIIDSTCNNVNPVFYDDPAQSINKVTKSFDTDTIMLTCTDYTDAYYQIGAIGTTAMHGFKAGDTLTLSLDQKQDIAGMQTVIFQYNGTAWTETEFKIHNVLAWSRVNHTFTLATTTKGWYIRFRFPKVAGSNTKKIWIKNVKLENGSIATPWSVNNGEITKKTNEIKQTTDSNTSAITSVTNRTGQLESKSTTMQQSIDGISTNVTNLTTTQGQQGTLINQQGTQITQLNNEITSRVKTTEMQDYIGTLGGINILSNTAFEDRMINATTGIITSRTPSLSKWVAFTPTADKSCTVDTSRTHDGYNSVKVETKNQASLTYQGFNQDIPLNNPSTGKYTASCWVYVEDKTLLDKGGTLSLRFYNGNTIVTRTDVALANVVVNNSWVFVKASLDVPAAAITSIRFVYYNNQNGVVWISQPQLQPGANPSAFMENPKDYANYDQLIGEVAKKVATSDYNQKITTIETSISQTNSRIDLKVDSSDVYNKATSDGRFGSKSIVEQHTSQISLMNTEINLRVKAGDIASTINQTAQAVLIQATKIYLDGFIEAKHLKAQELVGVTIKTAPSSENRWVELTKQDIRLYDGKEVRGYWGFYNRPNDNNALQPTFILGRNADSNIVGSLVITQVTPKIGGTEDFNRAYGTIGIASSYNATSNEFTRDAQITFSKNGDMNTEAKQYYVTSAGNVQIKGNLAYLQSKNEVFLESTKGEWWLTRPGKPANHNTIRFIDNNNDADLKLGYVTLRASYVAGYTTKVQVKDAKGEQFYDVEANGYLGKYVNVTDSVNCRIVNQTSTREIKTDIADIEIDSRAVFMSLKPQQYRFKSDIADLEEAIKNTPEGKTTPSIADVPLQYGFIAEDTNGVFSGKDKKSINTYNVSTLTVDNLQKTIVMQDEHEVKITQLEAKIEQQNIEKNKIEERLTLQDGEIAALKELVYQLMNK